MNDGIGRLNCRLHWTNMHPEWCLKLSLIKDNTKNYKSSCIKKFCDCSLHDFVTRKRCNYAQNIIQNKIIFWIQVPWSDSRTKNKHQIIWYLWYNSMLFLAILDKTCIDVPYIPVILLDGAFVCMRNTCSYSKCGCYACSQWQSLAASESMT